MDMLATSAVEGIVVERERATTRKFPADSFDRSSKEMVTVALTQVCDPRHHHEGVGKEALIVPSATAISR